MSQGFGINYLGGGRLDAPFFPTKTRPYIKGVRFEVPASNATAENKYVLNREAELISIAFSCSRYDDTDNLDVLINGEMIVESNYTKDLPEGLFFMVAHPMVVGDEIEIRFHNESGRAKSVWVNYQFLSDPPPDKFGLPEELPTGNAEFFLYDPSAQDGDAVTIYLNGVPIIQEQVITNVGTSFLFPIKTGENTIIIEGVSAGYLRECSFAMNITDKDGSIYSVEVDFPRENVEEPDSLSYNPDSDLITVPIAPYIIRPRHTWRVTGV